jgi:hypothetical protein
MDVDFSEGIVSQARETPAMAGMKVIAEPREVVYRLVLPRVCLSL